MDTSRGFNSKGSIFSSVLLQIYTKSFSIFHQNPHRVGFPFTHSFSIPLLWTCLQLLAPVAFILTLMYSEVCLIRSFSNSTGSKTVELTDFYRNRRKTTRTLLWRIPSSVMKINKMSTEITCLIHHHPSTEKLCVFFPCCYLLPMTLIKLEKAEANK